MLSGIRSPRGAAVALDGGMGAAVGQTGGPRACLGVSNQFQVALQGRIYNREEAGAKASVNAPNDAAVFASLVEKLGFVEALRSINGDFAVACLDLRDGTLWIGRDRMGVRPLYYAGTREGVGFSSQIAALLELNGVSRRANRGFVARFAGLHYRTFDNAPGESPFEDVSQLPAAHYVKIRAGRILDLASYWQLEAKPAFTMPEREIADAYRDLLIDAVARRTCVAGASAFTLSGGMDSSSVLACAVKSSGRKQQAYSTVYDDPTYDESDEIRSMLDATVEKWNPIRIGVPDVPGLVARMVRAQDEPVATATWLSHFLLCEQASKAGVESLFGGLGGDELNAGEYEYFMLFFADLMTAGASEVLDGEVDAWAKHHDHPIYRKSRAIVDARLPQLVDLTRPGICLVDDARLERYRAAVRPAFYDLAAFRPVMEAPFRSYLANRTFQDLTRETTPCCLRAEDRHTNHFGMENMDPFLDYRLVEFMFRVPGTLKIRHGVTKVLLRQAMSGILPDDTRLRVKKTGWNAPAHVWFSGVELGGVRDIVRSRRFRERGIYDVQVVDRILDEHVEIVRDGCQAENHMMFIWQLLNLETWLDELKVEI
ncbi:asparagine synthetase B family protein [Bradyrhizobium sp. HKCCYLS2038]|uniref:asparagine synthetase B family protein n=1 Tax=Bradyrhizobium sp. HKCCYLRH3095 TaxID=3420765 RepID=UPI003EB891BC